MFPVIITACLSIAQFSIGARILGIVPTPSYSHQYYFHPMWRELSLRGHNVTIITTDPVNAPELTNLTQIDVSYAYKYLHTLYQQIPRLDSLSLISIAQATFDKASESELSHPKVRQLINTEEKFDVVISESFFPEFLAFGEIYKCPTILISSLELQSTIHMAVGNPFHPVLYPEFVLPLYGKLNFMERIISTVYQSCINVYRMYIVYPRKHQIAIKYFGSHVPPIMDMLKKVSLILVGTDPVLYDVRALGPTTITFGGIHLQPPKPLTKDLQNYLDSASNGFIYFSLGTNIHSHLLTKEKIKIILDALKEIPFKILWKYASDDLLEIPENVKILKWIPQQDVLRHPNIKLFITQGGLQSTEEAIMYNVPMLVMPFAGDQPYNAKRLEYKNVARIIFHHELQKDKLKNHILEVIYNPIYKENTKKLATLAKDQPMTGIKKVVWWTEYVIRNGGTKHLRNPAADLPWYQYILLDVIAAFIAFLGVVVTMLIISWTILRILFINSWKILKHFSYTTDQTEISSNKRGISERSDKAKIS